MDIFTGSGVAIVTPFCDDKSVNYEMLSVLIERQIQEGTDAIIVCGTTGEPATLTEEERREVIAFTVEKTAGRVPVIAGTGENCTENARNAAIQAKELGVDGILVVTPFYNKATQNGLYLHYRAVAEAVGELPVIIYNVPSRTGCNIRPETVARLAEDCANIAGVKEASGDIAGIAELSRLVGNKIAIYSGNDNQIVPVLSLGGKGVISVLANIVPRETHEMVTSYLLGDTGRALELQLRYLPLAQQLFSEVNPIPVKAALQEIGYDCGGLRLPLTELEPEHRKALVLEIQKLRETEFKTGR
jgi:4-hydroxy-tetrahydrodipicolinate synthase